MTISAKKLCAGLLLSVSVSVLASVPVAAQTIARAPVYSDPAGSAESAKGVVIIGYDSVTNSPCIIGSASTCSLQASGGGGSGGSTSVTYNSTLPTLTSGQTVGLQGDSSGELLVNIPSLLSVAATSALQATGNSSLATIATNTSGSATSALQATGNASLATIATASGTQATAANQATGNTALASIVTNTAASATSALQSTGNSSLATIATNTSGSATSALQSTANSSLATIATASGTQATAANQATGNTALSGILSEIGATTSPATGTANYFLSGIYSILGQPTPSGSNVIGGFTIADGSAVTFGSKADSAYTSGSASVISILKAIDRDINAPLPAGTNLLGSLSINQATPGTTNGVQVLTGSTTAVTQSTASALNATVVGTGTFAAQVTSLPALVAGTANVGVVGQAQASTTSGQYGQLVQGAVTTSAPSYTTAQSDPLSLTTGGALRGDISSIGGTTVSATTAQLGMNIVNIGGTAASAGLGNGSAVKSVGVIQATAIPQTDVSGGAFAGSGSVLGTVVTSTVGSGAVISSEVNVSALTLGSATSVFAVLQESRGGTNFSDIWVSDPITATGIISMPPTPVAGRRRWRFFSAGGTSTTVTATITTLELPTGSFPLTRQMRDYYAATNPFATMYNSTALTASTFVLGTLSTNTTPFYVEGSKVVSAFMVLAGSPTVTTQPVVTLQGSFDGTNFFNISGATMTGAGNGAYSVTASNVAYKFARLQVTTAAAYSSGTYTISNIGVNAVN